ncbi:MAG: PEP-CTERM sorting domain-containing protein [Phycisphaerales bacterium]|nr:PEP-CTERM sorting domain-containing protein [Phycisphaerales bacterium]
MRQLGLSVLTLAVAAGSASAAGPNVDATFLSINPGINFRWSVSGSGFGGNPDPSGYFNWTRTGGDYPGLQGNFTTFCLELTQSINFNQTYSFKVVDPAVAPGVSGPNGETQPLGALGKARMRELFGRFFNGLNTGSAIDGAAFQFAVWGIVYDANLVLNEPADTYILRDSAGLFPFAGGSDPAFNAAFAQAQTFLSQIDGTGPLADLIALTNPNDQDQIIPAPGALALLGLGGLAAGRRRRR